MKLLGIAAFAGLVLASTMASAATPGAGITGTRHDWSSPVVTDSAGVATSGGQSLLLYMKKPDDTTATAGTYVTPYPWYDPALAVTDPLTGTVTQKQGFQRVQIGQCTKCHTPHQAKSTNLLWNHTLSPTNYSWNVPETTAGTPYATFKGDTYKGPTTKCLSCHDGALSSTDGMWFNRASTAGAKYVAKPGSLNSGHEVAEADGNMSGTHPVAMPYPFMGVGSIYNGVASFADTGSGGLAMTEWIGNPVANGIRLFKDDGGGNITAGTAAGRTGIECASCHDVHNGARAMDVMLLTGKLQGAAVDGYICQSCHKK